ncbi:hypothetical protein KAR91_48090 [Candidatus Pacearchaeota archaeon]|nr:hypothetical protein [Candidatus Pacearchaeota archaeon]
MSEETGSMEKYGIENLKKLLNVGLESGNVAGHWASPGGKGPLELLRLTDEVMVLPSVEYRQLDDELKDLSVAEMAELQAHVAQKFDIPQDNVEGLVEHGLAMGWKVASLIQDGLKMAKLVEIAKTKPLPTQS